MRPSSLRLLAPFALSCALACGPEKPPQASEDAPKPAARLLGEAEPAADDSPTFDPGADQFVLTYAGDRGVFADCSAVEEVPENARGLVAVNVFGRRAPAGKVWLCNLSKPDGEGKFALEAVPRERFEELILGDGRSSKVELPGDLELPDVQPAPKGEVILYKTEWCGVCSKAQAYFEREGIEYVAKDIEKDPGAQAELAAKAKAAGVPMGSVPMIDVGGELLRGFDIKRIETLLGS